MTITQRIAIGFEKYSSSVENTGWMWEQIPYALTSFGITLGAIILVAIIAQLSSLCLTNKKKKRATFYKRTFKSYVRLFIILLCIIILLGSFSVAAYIVGVNLWNIILGYGILALFIGYMFSNSLQNVGSYILIRWNDKVEEEQYIIIRYLGIEGLVEDIGLLYAEIRDGDKPYQIQTSLLLNSQYMEVYDTKPVMTTKSLVASSVTTTGMVQRRRPETLPSYIVEL
jgi:small-conductance mechanosensitive channel